MGKLQEQMKQSFELLEEWGEEYPDNKRHPIIAESEDWEEIPKMLQAISGMAHVAILTQRPDSLVSMATVLRVVAETIYVKGYERGKNEHDNPLANWVVKGEGE